MPRPSKRPRAQGSAGDHAVVRVLEAVRRIFARRWTPALAAAPRRRR